MSLQGLNFLESCTHSRCGLEHAFRNPSLATDSDSMVLVDLFHELILGHGLCRVIYMPALILESSDSLRTDILKEEELEVLVVYGVKDLWSADVRGCCPAHSAEPIVESGRGVAGETEIDTEQGRLPAGAPVASRPYDIIYR